MSSALLTSVADLQAIAEWLAQQLSLDVGLLIRRGIQILAVLVLAYVGFRMLKLVTGRIEKSVDDGDPTTLSEREQRGKTLAQLLNSVGGVAIAVGAGLTILNFFIQIGPLLAGVGVAGLAISFGAQSLVKDVIAGFFILLENQFGVGDIVKVNGVGGVVERMTMRVVMLRDVHGVLHVVPNGSIDLVSNMTRGWARAIVDIGVAYKENVDNVIRVMRDVAAELWRDAEWKGLLFEEPAVWGVGQLADSSVNIRPPPMTLRLYNTLPRRVEAFEPLAPPRVTLYTCGPTVYNYAHIGNFRTFLFQDLLRRYLEAQGFDVLHIMNLTDVDDRTIKAAAAAGVPLTQHTEPFVQAFFQDRDYLRIRPAHVYPRATQYIDPMVELVSRLLEKGLAYRGEDGVYFAIGRFPTYGCLSQVERRELKTGARVASDEYAKEDARDFALWKFAVDVDEKVGAAWDAPFGRGRPGWHLECSAMSLQEIRRVGVQTLDIHAGAVDQIGRAHV